MSTPAKPPRDGKMLAAALGSAKRGWPVFPLAPRDKVPLTTHGFKDAATDPEAVRAMWAKHPDANIGCVPGRANKVVIDVDGPEDDAKALAAGVPAVDLGPEPQTLVCQTGRPGGGRHIWYDVPPGTVIPNDPRLGVTVRYQGGYVLLPPSVHPSGRRYQWLTKREPAPCPPALLARLTGTGIKSPPAGQPTLSDTVPKGHRNNTLPREVGHWLAHRLPEPEVLTLALARNATAYRPALKDAVVRNLVARLAEKERGKAKATPTTGPFAVLRVMDSAAPPPPAMLVDDLLLDADVNVWAGHGGAAKSVVALVTAVGVVLGRPVFGSRTVRRSGPVVLVCPEDGQAAVRMMLDAIAEGLALSAEDRATLAAGLFIVTDDATVNLCDDTARLRDTAKACSAVLVILDPLRNLLGGADENDNTVAGAVLDALRRDVCRGAGAAVLLTHHNRKPGKDAEKNTESSVHDVRGGGGWVNGARFVFAVVNKNGRVTLTAIKANRLRTGLTHELDLTISADPANHACWRLCTVSDRNPGGGRLAAELAYSLSANERAALAVLDDAREPGMRLSYSAWLKRSGLSDDAFDKLRKRLVKAGLAEPLETDKVTNLKTPIYLYRITDPGRARLAEPEAL